MTTGDHWSSDPRKLPIRDTKKTTAMPTWVEEYRNHQVDAVDKIVTAYENGTRVVVLSAPTGSGKTLIAETTRRMLGWGGLYVCSTKTLQDQVVSDFDYAQVLKGRANYPTLDYPDEFLAPTFGGRRTAADCDKKPGQRDPEEPREGMFAMASAHSPLVCSYCTEVAACPYEIAKSRAKVASDDNSQLAVLNTSYLLTECNYLGENSQFTGQHFVTADEADLLESELLSMLSISISQTMRKKYKLGLPKRKTVADAWTSWVREIVPKLDDATEVHKRELGKLLSRPRKGKKIPNDVVQKRREIQSLKRLTDRMGELITELERGDWIRTDDDSETVTFKPVRVARYGQKYLWKHSNYWLLMSATVIAPDEMMASLGIGDIPWTTVHVGSTFPVERRPIKVMPVASMTRATKDEAYPAMAKGVAKVFERHPDERILVHAVSYDLSRYLMETLKDSRCMTYASAFEREAALRDYLLMPKSVLIAPSMERGVDLEGDDCRVIVVCKIPFPNLGDKQVAARLHANDGQLWYSAETVRALVQMTGRGVRNEQDFCDTYILDRQFVSNIWKKSKDMLPAWWEQALVWGRGESAVTERPRTYTLKPSTRGLSYGGYPIPGFTRPFRWLGRWLRWLHRTLGSFDCDCEQCRDGYGPCGW